MYNISIQMLTGLIYWQLYNSSKEVIMLRDFVIGISLYKYHKES